MNTAIVTKVKTKSINYITLSTIAVNNLRGVAIRLGAVNVCGEWYVEVIGEKIQEKN